MIYLAKYNTYYVSQISSHDLPLQCMFSDNHRERGNVLEGHKAAGTPYQPRMKFNKAKTSKCMSRVVCQMQN